MSVLFGPSDEYVEPGFEDSIADESGPLDQVVYWGLLTLSAGISFLGLWKLGDLVVGLV